MIRGNSARRAGRGLRAWLLAAFAALPITAVLAATQYLYDDLGRLVLVANSDGSAAVYAHDENGNVLSITQWAASGPVIAAFSPMYGHAGTPVTILGTGFSTTPANNTVTIGGVAAAVSTATATTLVSSVSQGANTGPITVTVGGVTAVSAQSFTVYKPLIASFSPGLVAPGASVSITGANLNLVPGGTSLTVGGTTVAATSLSNNQAAFAAPNTTGGPIVVTTPYGQATSAASLVIVPNAVGVANVVDHDPADPNGASQVLAINQQNKTALLSFQGAASAFYSVQLEVLALTPSGGSINYSVYAPTGAGFASGSVSTTAPSIHLPKTTAAGRYLVAFNSGSKTSVQITAKVELDTALTADGTTLPLSTTAAYQSKRFTFNATAGDDLNFAITQLTLTPNPPNNVRIWVYRPDGYQMGSQYYCYASTTPGCSKDNNLNEVSLVNAPVTGPYTVHVVPQGAATMTFNATLSTDLVGTLTVGAPTTRTFDVPGRQALLTFAATANQTVALRFDSLAMAPAGTGIGYVVYHPNGNVVASNGNLTAATTLNLPNLAAGTYSVYVAPRNASMGSVQLTLANGTSGTLPTNGTTQSFSTTLPNQHGYFTFTATAGDDLGLAITNLAITPSSPNYARIAVVLPSGYLMSFSNSTNCPITTLPGCSFTMVNVPETGTYRVVVESMGQSTMSFDLTVSQDVTGTLTPGTPQSPAFDVPGRQAMLTFTATAGQVVALHVNAISLTPAGTPAELIVYAPNGQGIASHNNITAPMTFNLTNLSAGTYSVLVAPRNASMGSVQLTLANGTSGTLPTNGTTQSFSTTLPQQHGYFTFTATAGDDLGLAITNLAITPSSPNYARIAVVLPSGYLMSFSNSTNCPITTLPGCSFTMVNVPETGTYRVVVESMGQSTMSFDLTVSQDVTGTLTPGTPQSPAFDVPGRQAMLTFTATAGQVVALHVNAISLTPAGTPAELIVYAPNGQGIASHNNITAPMTFNLTNLSAGTYSVLVAPRNASMGSVQLTLANGTSGTLPTNGTTQSFSTTLPQQHGYFTFTATAGDDLGLAITNLAITPSSPNYARIAVVRPSGYLMSFSNSTNCPITTLPGCSFEMPNMPETGTYLVVVESMGQSTMSFDLTLSQHLTGTLALGTPQSINLDVPGRQALLTFAATSGQNVAVSLTSITTTPSGKTVRMYVLNPSGGYIVNTTTNSANLTNLPAGTYTVLLVPADAATVTLQAGIQ